MAGKSKNKHAKAAGARRTSVRQAALAHPPAAITTGTAATATGTSPPVGNDIDKLNAENEALKQQLASLLAEKTTIASATTVYGKSSIKVNAVAPNTVEKIDKAIKIGVWRKIKFWPPHEEDQYYVAALCSKYLDPEVTKDERDDWVAKFDRTVAAQLNGTRSYVQSELKKKWVQKYPNLEQLPSVLMLEKCVFRTIDVEDAEELDFMTWYVESLLPKACGFAKRFSLDQFGYTTLSEASPPNMPKLKAITPEDEAFVLVAYANVRDHIIEIYKEMKGKDPEMKAHVSTKTAPKEGDVIIKGTKVTLYGERFQSKWSNPAAGSDQSKGWSVEGIDQYEEYLRKAREARDTPECRALEQAVLDKIRKKHDITADSKEEEPKKRRVSEESDSKPSPKRRFAGLDVSDEEE